jgi:hypothetical protein
MAYYKCFIFAYFANSFAFFAVKKTFSTAPIPIWYYLILILANPAAKAGNRVYELTEANALAGI